MTRLSRLAVLGVLALALAAPGCAHAARRDSGYGYNVDVRRVAFERGFREGILEGERDGRGGSPFRYEDERDFQRADIGYHRGYGDPERYRVNFRSGFVEGYAEGYRRYARRGYGRDQGRYGAPAYGSYPHGRERGRGPFEIGARDGYEKGREDARSRNRADARRHKWYREGDREYDNRYGNREQYKNEYRRGFIAGYERGYLGR